MKDFLKISVTFLLLLTINISYGQETESTKVKNRPLQSLKESDFWPDSSVYSEDFLQSYNNALKVKAAQHRVVQNASSSSSVATPSPVGTCNVITCGSFNVDDTSYDEYIGVGGNGVYGVDVEYSCWDDHGTVDFSEGQYVSYSYSGANVSTPAIISPSPDGGGFAIFSFRNESIDQTVSVLPNTDYTVCFEIGVIPRYSNGASYETDPAGVLSEFEPNLNFGISSGGVQISGGDALEYTHSDLNIHPLSDFPSTLSTATSGAFQNAGGWTEIDPFWETVCITFTTDNSGEVNVYYETGNPGRSVVVVDGLRLSLEGYATPPTLQPESTAYPRVFCDPTTVELNDYITGSGPGGSVLTWSTNVDPLVVSDHLSNTTVNVPGAYYAFYYNSVDNCASPAVLLDLQLTDLSYTIVSKTDEDCAGSDTGEIVITGVDGASPYTYSIDGGSTSQNSGTFSNLADGTYVIIVTDSMGCEVTTSDIIIDTLITDTTCAILKDDCPPIIDPVCADSDLGGIVSWTPPSFSYRCCTAITGDEYSFFMEFDLPESSSGCWDYNRVQRIGSNNLRLWQSTGSGDPYFTTPLQYFNTLNNVPISMDLIIGSGQNINWELQVLDGVSIVHTQTISNITTTGPQTITIPSSVPSGAYHLKLIFSGTGNNQCYVDRLFYNATLLDVACSDGINFVVTSTHNPGDLFPIGNTTVT